MSYIQVMWNKIKLQSWHLRLSLRHWLSQDQAMTKCKLLEVLHEERDQWRAILAKLNDSQISAPGVLDHWSLKDLLAHISVWDRRGTTWIKMAAEGVMPMIPEPGLNRKDFDRLNHQTYLENRDKPLGEVIDEFNHSYRALIERVEALPEEVAGQPVLAELISWRAKHSRRHRYDVNKWLDGLHADDR